MWYINEVFPIHQWYSPHWVQSWKRCHMRWPNVPITLRHWYGILVNDEFREHAAKTLKLMFDVPVKYLGMPLTSWRYSVTDCEYLVDKMTARIRVWYARNLSYTAWLQLVNSVLMSITNYWFQAVILPKKVIRQVNAICRSFLWHGSSEAKSPGNTNWEKVCKPKKEGGLGIRNLETWNLDVIGKITWHISVFHESLWVKWVHEVYTKGGNSVVFNAPITR